MAAGKLPGASFAVVHRGEQVAENSVGKRDISADEDIEGSTMLRVASVSKAITAAAVLLLVEDGMLGLNDPVSAHM